MPVSPIELLLALVAVVFGALVQGSIGLGLGIFTVPVLSLINPIMAPVPSLLLAAPLTVAMAWRERSHIELSGAGFLLVGRLPGALLGLGLLAVATQRTLDIWIAASVLAAVAILSTRIKVPRNGATEFTTGVLSGITGMVASMGGPPAALLFKDETGPKIRATLSMVFSVGLIITVLARLLAGRITVDDIVIAVLLLPGLAAGYVTSSRLRGRVDTMAFKPAILVISSIAATGLLLRAITG
ncbi:MAG: sulfite exporter TauE/SafE family protein [Acidimicrobiia bacterium]|nr:sulfite exporter TauE/SafE family protein [Acidimicrobiia bacterium]